MFWRKIASQYAFPLLTAALLLALALPLAADAFPGEAWGSPSGSYLGIDSRDVTADRLAPLKLKEERGVEVTLVDQDAPAGKAGLREHDVILTFNGQPVESVEELRRMIRETPAGRTVALGVSRDGQPITLQATLADRRKTMVLAAPVAPEVPEAPMVPEMPAVVIPNVEIDFGHSASRAGLLVENLTPQLAEFFGARNGEGVLIRSVEKGSAAAAAGFKAGDVIIRVDKDKVTDLSDWRMALHQHKGGKVPVVVLRDKKEQTITLAVPSRERGSLSGFDFDMPDLDTGYLQLERRMQLLTPEIERSAAAAVDLASATLTEQMAELRKEMARATRDAQKQLEKQRKEMQKAARDAARRTRDAQRRHAPDPPDQP